MCIELDWSPAQIPNAHQAKKQPGRFNQRFPFHSPSAFLLSHRKFQSWPSHLSVSENKHLRETPLETGRSLRCPVATRKKKKDTLFWLVDFEGEPFPPPKKNEKKGHHRATGSFRFQTPRSGGNSPWRKALQSERLWAAQHLHLLLQDLDAVRLGCGGTHR